jgi:hypothetical protein
MRTQSNSARLGARKDSSHLLQTRAVIQRRVGAPTPNLVEILIHGYQGIKVRRKGFGRWARKGYTVRWLLKDILYLAKQLTLIMSLAVHAASTPEVLKFPMTAEALLPPVCLQTNTVVEVVLMSVQVQFQAVDAVGKPIVPVVATPPVPTFTVNDVVPLLLGIDGDTPKPAAMVGAAAENKSFPLSSTPAVFGRVRMKLPSESACMVTSLWRPPPPYREKVMYCDGLGLDPVRVPT